MAKLDTPTKIGIGVMTAIVIIFAFIFTSNYQSSEEIVCQIYEADDNVTTIVEEGTTFYVVDNGFGDQIRLSQAIVDSCS